MGCAAPRTRRGGKRGACLGSPRCFFPLKPTACGKLQKRSQSLIFWKLIPPPPPSSNPKLWLAQEEALYPPRALAAAVPSRPRPPRTPGCPPPPPAVPRNNAASAPGQRDAGRGGGDNSHPSTSTARLPRLQSICLFVGWWWCFVLFFNYFYCFPAHSIHLQTVLGARAHHHHPPKGWSPGRDDRE